ncbi:MAG: sulfurtransferase complex subunit TusB [Piscirickettsiaceae bacterium]|nr:MAG: sulfurtransferase complex subunit TusB [Piscirickettsiaceae bacterium]
MLHILNKNNETLTDCLKVIDKNSVIVLIEDAVFFAIDNQMSVALKQLPVGVNVFALSPDLDARGIETSQCYGFVNVLDYSGFVQLVVENNPIRSWF